ncbi:MAG: hypothetical protein KA319_11480 [Ferruginibacter sp.]|nr:hypothetical protein [Ferruginibacter sp.]
MNKLKFLSILAIAVVTLNSCYKGDSDKTRKELLTQGGWILQGKLTKAGTAVDFTDVTSSISTCKKDDIQSFNTTGQYGKSEGASKCNAGDPDVIATGTWEFLTNETELKVVVPSSTITYKIEGIAQNSLILVETDESGIVVVVNKYIYIHS